MFKRAFKIIFIWKVAVVFIILTALFSFYFYSKKDEQKNLVKTDFYQEKVVVLNDNGLISKTSTKATKVRNYLLEKNIKLKERDIVIPGLNEPLSSSAYIFIVRSKKIKLDIGGEIKEVFTQENTVQGLLLKENIEYAPEDKIIPSLESQLYPEMEVVVIRVLKKTETKEKEISFKEVVKKDPELDYGRERIVQEGKNGLKEEEYQIIYENGKEVKRILLSERVIKEPVNKIIIRGTKITPLASESGLASWYGGRGSLSAAHRYFPFGSKVRVINKINNKSVIVTVNDRGPFLPKRVIDLSKDAYLKIASLGSGVIPVVVQRIK